MGILTIYKKVPVILIRAMKCRAITFSKTILILSFACFMLLFVISENNTDRQLRVNLLQYGQKTPITQLQMLLNDHKEEKDISKSPDIKMFLLTKSVDDFNNDYLLFTNKTVTNNEYNKHSQSKFLHYLSAEPDIDEKEFRPYIGVKDKFILYETLQKIYEVCESLQFNCMMYSGTLLGSWRHHDIIPWDGDADIIANATEKDELFSALAMLSPSYEVHDSGTRFKFYSSKATQTSKYPWKWPYVDIWFFKENATHIWDEVPSRAFMREYVYSKSIIFPTHLRPFGKILFKAPFDSFATLQITYKTTDCETYFYNHKTEQNQLEMFRSIPCYNLRNQVAFVFRMRTEHKNKLLEVLIKGKDVINVQIVDEPLYAVTNPFNLTLL